MKKILSLLLAAVMVFTLMACTAKPETPGTDVPPAADTVTPPADTTPPPAESETPPAETEPAVTGDDDWAYILDKGTIIIGITPYEPMNYEDETGELVGFDTEFAKELCMLIGVTPEFKWIDWNTKEIELKAKNIDCIWNGLTVTEERRENMAFTSSYLRNEQVVVIRAADADKYTDLASLADARLVAEDESAGATAIESDLPDAAYTPVVSQAMALLEVKSGTADAAVIDFTMARAMTGEGTDYADLIVVTSIKMLPEEYAIGLRVGSSALKPFNDSIDYLTQDGTMSALAEKYGVSDLLIK